jgi:hypothetical protein
MLMAGSHRASTKSGFKTECRLYGGSDAVKDPVFSVKLRKFVNEADNFRMDTRSGRYGAAYNMVGLRCLKRRTFVVAKESNRGKATSY